MKKFIKDILLGICSNISVILISATISAIISVGTSVWVVIRQTKELIVPIYGWILLFVSLLIAVGCITSCIVFSIRKSKRPVFPKILSDVKYEKIVLELYFKDRDNIYVNRDIRFVVLRDKMEGLRKSFTWTGSGYKSTVLIDAPPEYEIIEYKEKQPRQSYDVKFDSTKTRGDIVEYKTKTDLEDREHKMKPVLSYLVKGSIAYLELRVTAPKGLLKDVRFLISADTAAEIPLANPILISPKNVGDLEAYEYIVKKPNLLYNYQMEWKFTN